MPDPRRAARARVAINVRRLRTTREISQERLAELAGNTAKHIGQIERGEVNVGLDILERIAAALAVDIADLFTTTPRRRRAEPDLYAVNASELDGMQAILDGIRAARLRTPERDT